MASSSPPKKMEESIITLPMLQEGVIALGDLWDCRSRTCPGTILNEALSPKYAECHPMRALDYKLTRVRNTADKMYNLKISADLKFDLLEGLLKIHGESTYDGEDVKDFNQEELSVDYLLYSYKLRVRPNVKEILNRDMMNKITGPKTVSATHFVQEVLIGAHAVSTIRYKRKVDKKNFHLTGGFDGSLDLGFITAEVKMRLEMLDKDEKENYETSISLRASPPLPKTPTSVEEMFHQIDTVDETVKREEHYKELFPDKSPPIFGVPLHFKLVPLTQLFDEELTSVYEVMKQEVLDAFLEMVCTFQDFQGPDYLKSLLVQQCPQLVTILGDPFNQFTKDITDREIELMKKSKELKAEAFLLFGKFTQGEVTEVELNGLLQENDKHFNLVEIYKEMYHNAEKGKRLLTAIHAGDTLPEGQAREDADGDDMTTRVLFFTNKEDLEDWWTGERTIKLLMQTKMEVNEEGDEKKGKVSAATSPAGTFVKLFDMSSTLMRRHGLEVGVALPNISDDNSLTFKIGSREVLYGREEIQFALEVLSIAIDKGAAMSTLFYTINNALCGVFQPYDLRDITSLISIMRMYSDVAVCESYVQLLDRVTGQPAPWTFVLPLEATHSASESVRFFRQLRLDFPAQFPGVEHAWVVGRFNSTQHEGPLLLVFRHEQLQAVCMDHLDLLSLLQQFKAMGNAVRGGPPRTELRVHHRATPGSAAAPPTHLSYPELVPLSPQSVRPQCFYPERANFILPLVENLSIHEHQSHRYEPVADLLSFPREEHDHMTQALELLRTVVSRREVQTLSAVTRHAIDNALPGQPCLETEVLLPGEKVCGWRSSARAFVSTNGAERNWGKFSEELDAFIAKMAPHLSLVQLSIKDLKDFVKRVEDMAPEKKHESEAGPSGSIPTDEQITREVEASIAPFHKSTEPAYAQLKTAIDKLAHVAPKPKLYAVLNLLQVFYAKALTAESFFYVGILKSLADNLASKEVASKEVASKEVGSIKPLYQYVVGRYVARLLEPPKAEAAPTPTPDPAEPETGPPTPENTEPETGPPNPENTPTPEKATEKTPPPPLINEAEFPSMRRLILASLSESNFFKVLTLLVRCTRAPQMFRLQLELYNLSSVVSVEAMKDVVEHMHEWAFTAPQRKDVWLNPKFQAWMTRGLKNEALLEAIKFRVCVGGGANGLQIPRWLPEPIVERLKPLFFSMILEDYPWDKDWADVQSFVQVLQAVVTRGRFPLGFMDALQERVGKDDGLKAALLTAGVLYFWNTNFHHFQEPWSLRTASVALHLLMHGLQAEREAVELELRLEEEQADVDDAWTVFPTQEERGLEPIVVNWNWDRVTSNDGTMSVTGHHEWNVLSSLPSRRPFIQSEAQLPSALRVISQYLLATLFKTGEGCVVLGDGASVASLLNYAQWAEEERGPRPGYIEWLDSDDEGELVRLKPFLLSRGDLLSALCANLCSPLLTLHLCGALHAQLGSRVALPLVVPAIEMELPNSVVAKSLFPLLREVRTLAGGPILAHGSRFITAIRVGDGGGGRPGKSTLLNRHVLNNDNFFSCCLEPGSEHGPPLQRPGLVEFTALTPETSSHAFWKSCGPQLEGDEGGRAYLANVHGDAGSEELGPTLQHMAHFTSCFIVFWRTGDMAEMSRKRKRISGLLGGRAGALSLVLDPNPTIIGLVQDKQNIIFTTLADGAGVPPTPQKVHNVFMRALSWPAAGTGHRGDLEPTPGVALVSIHTEPSDALLNLVREITGSTIRTIFQLVQSTLSRCTCEAGYRQEVKALLAQNPLLERALKLFIGVLNLAPPERAGALTHLHLQLEEHSRGLRQRYVDRILKLEAELLGYVTTAGSEGGPSGLDVVYIGSLQEEIKRVRHARDSMTLDVAQFWKQLDYILPLHAPHAYDAYLSAYAELAEVGWATQLEDGDDGAENPALHASFRTRPVRHIFRAMHPDTRVFVVSVLGLRSSGKSTLLNSVFGNPCGAFTTGAAGCTTGLVFRMHRLSTELRRALKLDMLLVIDSEGVGSAESYLDDAANVFERQLATFLLGVSHLTLVHVVEPNVERGGGTGRGFDELGPILEIAITTLTTLPDTRLTGDLDILFVYEEGAPGGDPPFLKEFKQSLAHVTHFTRAPQHELLLGVQTRASQVLNLITQRVRHSEILFNAPAPGSAHTGGSLFNQVLNICSQSTERRIGIRAWYDFKDSFNATVKALGSGRLDAATKESGGALCPQSRVSPLLYKSLADLQNGCADLLRKMSEVKRLIDLAYRHHVTQIESQLDEKLKELLYDKDVTDLEPYPSQPPPPSIIEDKNNRLEQQLRKQSSRLFKTINTCDDAAGAAGENGDGDGGGVCGACAEAYTAREALITEISDGSCVGRRRQIELLEHLRAYEREVRDTAWARMEQRVFSARLRYGCVQKVHDMERDQKRLFVSGQVKVVSGWRLLQAEVLHEYSAMSRAFMDRFSSVERLDVEPLPDLEAIQAFDVDVYNQTTRLDSSSLSAAKASRLSWGQADWLQARLEDLPAIIATEWSAQLFLPGMVRTLQRKMLPILAEFEEFCEERLDVNFLWEAHLYALTLLGRWVQKAQAEWDTNEDEPKNPFVVLERYLEECNVTGEDVLSKHIS